MIDFLFTATGGRIIIILIGLLLVAGLFLKGSCEQVNVNQTAENYAAEITNIKAKSMEAEVKSLKAELEKIEPPKKKSNILDIFKPKPREVPPEMIKTNEELNALGEEFEKLGRDSNK